LSAQLSGTASLDDPIEISIFDESGKISHQTVSTSGTDIWSATFPIQLCNRAGRWISASFSKEDRKHATCWEYSIPSWLSVTNTDVVSGSGWNHRATVTLKYDAYTDTQSVGSDEEVTFNLMAYSILVQGRRSLDRWDCHPHRSEAIMIHGLNYMSTPMWLRGMDWLVGSTLTLTIDDLDNGCGREIIPPPW
jgi:hypothetical protein